MPGCASTPIASQTLIGALFPLRNDRLCFAVLDRMPRCAKCLLADEDAVDRCGSLQASSRVDDVPHGQWLAFRSDGADRDVRLAGRNGDTCLLGPVRLGEPVPDRERRADGSLGVVLVRNRGAEDGHDRVADELLHCASEVLELRTNVRVVGHEERAYVLWVEPLGSRRRADDVAEQNGDELARLARHSVVKQRRCAGVAVASPFGVSLTTPRADVHARQRTTAATQRGGRGSERARRRPFIGAAKRAELMALPGISRADAAEFFARLR